MAVKQATVEFNSGKWITGLKPRMPMREAAARALPARLMVVLHYLPRAVEAAAEDIEYVHQLRVASRRAAAALSLFASCLPEKQAKTLRKGLRGIRRSAGDARDWDVFLAAIEGASAFKTDDAQPGRDLLVGVAAARRMEAQELLFEVAEYDGKRFEEQVGHFLDGTIDWHAGDRSTVGELAEETIKALVAEIAERTSPAPDDYAQLHALRILGKRLRYSMEIFVDCFDPPFREQFYPAVEEMQEILGHITDAHVMAERMGRIRDHLSAFHGPRWPRYRKPISQFLRAQHLVLPRQRKRFNAWLPKWQALGIQLGWKV